ncbi:hypothetical protein T265_15789, partial [Opisthorchis viverrini]
MRSENLNSRVVIHLNVRTTLTTYCRYVQLGHQNSTNIPVEFIKMMHVQLYACQIHGLF